MTNKELLDTLGNAKFTFSANCCCGLVGDENCECGRCRRKRGQEVTENTERRAAAISAYAQMMHQEYMRKFFADKEKHEDSVCSVTIERNSAG